MAIIYGLSSGTLPKPNLSNLEFFLLLVKLQKNLALFKPVINCHHPVQSLSLSETSL